MNNSNVPLAGFGIWVAGWLLLLTVLYLLTRNRAGETIVYYILWLSIVLLLVTHSDSITQLFQQANIFQGQY